MSNSADEADLRQIPVEKIDRNDDNPRILFRPGEMEDLLESIRQYGVLVPITVYREKGRFVLIDGERRWKCALKLNHRTIPALVQDKPERLQNLLLMFNIHALREQWDLLTIALKLPKIIELLADDLGSTPTERAISERTGLSRAIIRRSKLLMNLPDRYKQQILSELEKPKGNQRFTEDLFIEMERALTTVERAMPDLIPDRDRVRRILLKKFKKKIINNRVLFRDIAKIARAGKVGADVELAATELRKLFADNNYTIEQAFAGSVGEAYAERDIGSRVATLLGLLDELDVDELEDTVREKLEELLERIRSLLRATS
jgi:ParB family transcriptional regulator, chromosome partitioning protein